MTAGISFGHLERPSGITLKTFHTVWIWVWWQQTANRAAKVCKISKSVFNNCFIFAFLICFGNHLYLMINTPLYLLNRISHAHIFELQLKVCLSAFRKMHYFLKILLHILIRHSWLFVLPVWHFFHADHLKTVWNTTCISTLKIQTFGTFSFHCLC